MMRILLALLLLVGFAETALSRPVTIEYQLAGADCAGDPTPAADYEGIEIYFDTVAIPITAADSCEFTDDGAGNTVPVDTPPSASATMIPGTTDDPDGDGTYTVSSSLPPGTYYVRMRAMLGGTWSNLSNQIMQVVPQGNGRPPFLIRLNF